MIFDTIENCELYKDVSPAIGKALEALKTFDLEGKDGRYDIDGENIFFIVQRYKSRPKQEKLEAHKNYIDIQYIDSGSEQIGYRCAKGLKPSVAYDKEKDVQFFADSDETIFLNMTKGSFAIFWPDDAHMPGCQIDGPEDILKVVIKIKV